MTLPCWNLSLDRQTLSERLSSLHCKIQNRQQRARKKRVRRVVSAIFLFWKTRRSKCSVCSVFLDRARRRLDGLMESLLRRGCHCHQAGPPPPRGPVACWGVSAEREVAQRGGEPRGGGSLWGGGEPRGGSSITLSHDSIM